MPSKSHVIIAIVAACIPLTFRRVGCVLALLLSIGVTK